MDLQSTAMGNIMAAGTATISIKENKTNILFSKYMTVFMCTHEFVCLSLVYTNN